MGDVEMALALVARRQGRREMTRQEWMHVLSLDLGWMPPGDARRLVERAEGSGLLQAEGERLRLMVDPSQVQVPAFFRPRPDANPETHASPTPPGGFAAWLETYSRHAGCERAEALRRVAARQAEMQGLLGADAALLWLASEAGLDVRAAAARLIQGPVAKAATP